MSKKVYFPFLLFSSLVTISLFSLAPSLAEPNLLEGLDPSTAADLTVKNDADITPSNDGFFSQAFQLGEKPTTILPIDKTVSERQKDILNPIELDIDSLDVLDLNIEKALLISLESNIPQKIVDQITKRDKWRFWGAGSQLLPDISLGYLYTDFSNQPGGFSIITGRTHRVQAALRYDLGPSEVFSTLAAYYDWMASSQAQGANLQELMRQTINQYYEVVRTRGELSARVEAVKQSRDIVTLNEKLEEAGVGTKFSVYQAQEQLYNNELALESQQAAARIAEVQLLNTLNLPFGTDIRLCEETVTPNTLISREYSIPELVELAFANRPDITQRIFANKAAKKRVNQAFSSFLPNFIATASTSSLALRFGNAFNPSRFDDLQLLSVGFDWPILTGLGLRQVSAINETKAIFKQTALEVENQLLTVEQQVRESFLQSSASQERIITAEKQVEVSAEAVKLARVRLANGVGTNIDLIDTQRNYVNALVNKVRAIVDYNQSQINLMRSIGLISLENVVGKTLAVKPLEQSIEEENKDDKSFKQAIYR